MKLLGLIVARGVILAGITIFAIDGVNGGPVELDVVLIGMGVLCLGGTFIDFNNMGPF